MKNQIKVYVSHSIRGKKGIKATKEDMRHNNTLAIVFGQALRRKFSKTEFYVPGDHDEFVLLAYLKKYINVKQMLEIDCDIVSSCNLLLNYSPDGYISRGMTVENDYAALHGIPIITLKSTSKRELRKLDRFLESVLKG